MAKDGLYPATKDLPMSAFISETTDRETGEVTTYKPPATRRRVPCGYLRWAPSEQFQKSYKRAEDYLYYVLNANEHKILAYMRKSAAYGTNSLQPLDNKWTQAQLAELFDIPIRNIKPALAKLKSLGIYAQFEIDEVGEPDVKHWILSPYVSFNGSYMPESLLILFRNTKLAQAIGPYDYK